MQQVIKADKRGGKEATANAMQRSQLQNSDLHVRHDALNALGKLEPATLAQHAVAVVARLEDTEWLVRKKALETLGKLNPATLAHHAAALVARLEDSDLVVRKVALETLRKLEPATLAQHACAMVARLEDSELEVRYEALQTMGKLKPATLAQHAFAVVARLEDSNEDDSVGPLMLHHAVSILHHGLPRFVRHGINFGHSRYLNNDEDDVDRYLNDDDIDFYDMSRRLMGRIAWYRCRIRLRVRSLSLYWYALPYRPSGPGHARDVEAWTHMIEE